MSSALPDGCFLIESLRFSGWTEMERFVCCWPLWARVAEAVWLWFWLEPLPNAASRAAATAAAMAFVPAGRSDERWLSLLACCWCVPPRCGPCTWGVGAWLCARREDALVVGPADWERGANPSEPLLPGADNAVVAPEAPAPLRPGCAVPEEPVFIPCSSHACGGRWM